MALTPEKTAEAYFVAGVTLTVESDVRAKTSKSALTDDEIARYIERIVLAADKGLPEYAAVSERAFALLKL